MDPAAPLFVFDGDCGFCRKWSTWLQRHIGDAATFVPSQSIDIGAFGLTPDDVATASYWVDERGRTYRGNRSFARALRHAGLGWRLAAALSDLPGVRLLTATIYRAVVRNRHRLPAPRS